MRYLIVVLTIILVYGCSEDTNDKMVRKKVLQEKEVPYKAIEMLMKQARLKTIDSGVTGFEVRKWGPFINDTFPLFLKRLFVEDNVLKGELYFFQQANDKTISGFNEIKNIPNIKIDKYTINNLEYRYVDSLKYYFDLLYLNKLDPNIVKDKHQKGLILHSLSMMFVEEATESQYISSFNSYPSSFIYDSDTYMLLSKINNLIEDEIVIKKPEAFKWINDHISATYSDSVKYE